MIIGLPSSLTLILIGVYVLVLYEANINVNLRNSCYTMNRGNKSANIVAEGTIPGWM